MKVAPVSRPAVVRTSTSAPLSTATTHIFEGAQTQTQRGPAEAPKPTNDCHPERAQRVEGPASSFRRFERARLQSCRSGPKIGVGFSPCGMYFRKEPGVSTLGKIQQNRAGLQPQRKTHPPANSMHIRINHPPPAMSPVGRTRK